MIWAWILLCIGFLIGFLIFVILSMSRKRNRLKDHPSLSIIDKQGTVENFPNVLGNAICPGSETKEIKPTTQTISWKKGKILYVDDDEYLLDLIGRMLRHLGYDVVVWESSLDALNYLKSIKYNFDLIIVDQVMAGLSGTEFAQKVGHLQTGVPVILLTGFGDMVPLEEIKEINVKEVIAKPIMLSDFAKIINRILSYSETKQT
jgi:CheY-like chemotaxis protein